MKEIEKYVGYYLLVYLAVLVFCGFIEYISECQGQPLSCALSKDGFNTIITTTAYILTPIVAIVGFLNWKQEKQYDIEKHYAEVILNNVNEIRDYLHKYYHQINAYNNTESAKNALDHFQNFDLLNREYLISSKFKTLQQLLNEPLSDNLLHNFENEILSFITAISVAKNDELPFPPHKPIVVKVTSPTKISLVNRCENLSKFKLHFDKSYDDLTTNLLKIIKPLK